MDHQGDRSGVMNWTERRHSWAAFPRCNLPGAQTGGVMMADHPFDDPQPVDDTLLERIESEQEELTDQLFFRLIKETPLYLVHWPFQKRIAQWQYCLDNPVYSIIEQKAAKKNLIQIGKALSSERRGQPVKIPNIAIYHHYKIAIEEIDKFYHHRSKMRPKSPDKKRPQT
jgi:hypothetical protein